MYEQYTFDYLMDRALDRVPNTMDKRVGSIIYDALAPAENELSLAYLELQHLDDNNSPDTAVGKALTDMASQNGVFRKTAIKAQRKGEFNAAVPIGSEFSIDSLIFTVISGISDFNYNLECSDAGEIGNIPVGVLLPLDYIEGLSTANLTDVIIAGANEETDDQLRERYKQNLINPPQDGNSAQYLKWATDYPGVGTAKVFPLWNGGNTVKVAITNRLFTPAEQGLVDAFQLYMDPNSSGLGDGVAILGSKVTITGGTPKNIDITANITLADGYTSPEGVEDGIKNYLASIVFKKDSVSYMKIGSTISDYNSVSDISGLIINGSNENISLINDEIPVLNSLNLVVV